MDRLSRPSKHHVLFPRLEWEMRPETRRMRQSRSMMPIISRGDHDHLHRVVPLVPLIGHNTLVNIRGLWAPENNTLADIDSLCSAIDQAAAPCKVNRLERDLAGLAIESLMMQRDLLKEMEIPR